MSTIRHIYDAIGFLPKAEQNKLMQQGKKISSPYEEGLQKLADALAYLQSITKERKQYLRASTAGSCISRRFRRDCKGVGDP